MKIVKEKSAQDIQNDIFRGMSADKKITCASDLWRLAKELNAQKTDFRVNRSAVFSRTR